MGKAVTGYEMRIKKLMAVVILVSVSVLTFTQEAKSIEITEITKHTGLANAVILSDIKRELLALWQWE